MWYQEQEEVSSVVCATLALGHHSPCVHSCWALHWCNTWKPQKRFPHTSVLLPTSSEAPPGETCSSGRRDNSPSAPQRLERRNYPCKQNRWERLRGHLGRCTNVVMQEHSHPGRETATYRPEASTSWCRSLHLIQIQATGDCFVKKTSHLPGPKRA